MPDGLPAAGTEVLLDQSILKRDYTVELPSGNSSVSLTRLRVVPSAGGIIRLTLPKGNTAAPALRLTGNGDCLVLGEGSTFTNASGAGSGDPIAFSGSLRLENGATYIHNTARGNARVVEKLATTPGTEKGMFVFDVPGTAAYTLSLSGRTFGRLVIRSAASGGTKRYNGSGSSALTIRGGLVIEQGATLGTALTADIRIENGIRLDGALSLSPSSPGSVARSLVFEGNDSSAITGSGSLTLLTNFRNIVVDTGCVLRLDKDLELPSTGHSLVVRRNSTLILGESNVSGAGRFANEARSTLCIGSDQGVRHTGAYGNIRTTLCELDTGASYVFIRNGPQITGDGLPRRIRILKVDKPTGALTLSADTEVYSELHLNTGVITTSAAAMLTFSGDRMNSPPNAYGDTDGGWEGGYVDGPFRRFSIDTGLSVLPVGREGVFAPVRLYRSQAGPLAFTAEYHPRPYTHLEPVSNPPLGQVSRYEHWVLHAEGSAPDPSSRLALSWRSVQGRQASWRDSLRIAQYENRGMRFQWEMIGDRPIASGSGDRGYVTSDRPWGIDGALTLASASPFAVLTKTTPRLEALYRDGNRVLRWECASASSCSGCELQRSTQGRPFTTFHIRNRWMREPAVQEHPDPRPQTGVNLYRVACRLLNGGMEHSNVVSVSGKAGKDLRIHPNPTSGILYVEGVGYGESAHVTVTDALGVTVWHSKEISDGNSRLDLSGLRPGLYILRWRWGGDVRSLPFFKR
jgi:hypothetical protein